MLKTLDELGIADNTLVVFTADNGNIAAEHPEVIEMLKKELADIIKKGRSTPGPNLPSDHNDPNVKWPQIDVVRGYIE